MALCWPSLLVHLLLLSLHLEQIHASISLSNELTNFIPACARACFESFLENSFPASICSDNPTLDCLCSSNSISGYTVGEGAVQCIAAEDNIGFCTGTDANSESLRWVCATDADLRTDEVASNAFTMCNGRDDAIPNTHKTITASLVVQTSMPSIVLIAPAVTSISRATSSSRISQSEPSKNTPTPTTFTTMSSTPAVTSDVNTATSTEAATAAAKATDPSLTKPQKIAIISASVGGVAIVAGILLLILCLKRRRQRARDSDILPFQADPGTPRIYGGFRGPTEVTSAKSSNGSWGKNAPRIPPRLDTSDPYMFSRTSIKPDTIGVAISPERNGPIEAKRSSRLLPEKPTLTLNTSLPVAGAGMQTTQNPQRLIRQSTATQFEEEDDSADTAFEEYYGRGSSDQILAKDEASNLKTIKVIEPNSRPSLYITNPDKSNYSPPQTQTIGTSSDSYTQPLSIGRGVGSFSRPLPGPEPRVSQLQVPSRAYSQNQSSRPITAGSSVYSTASNTPYAAAPPSGPLSANESPLQLPNQQTQKRDQYQTRNYKSYQQNGPYDRVSNGSFTSFDSEDSSPDKEYPRHTLMLDLSPVVESPVSPSGRSPVSYPRIAPAGRLPQQTIRMVPPPPQPDFASIFSSGGGRTQPNVQPFSNTARQKPWQAAEIAAARQRRLSQAPNQAQARSQTYPVPQTRVQTKPATADELRQYQTQNQNEKVQPKLASPFKPQSPAVSYLPGTHARQRSRDYIAPSAHFNSATTQLRPHARLRDGSPTPSFASQNSTSSSLLTKRIGAEKAAQLSLQPKSDEERRNGAKWRVLGREERERAKDPGWKPQLVGRVEGQTQAGRSGEGQRSGGQLYMGYENGSGDGGDPELPKTPGWVPRLTPTRRGDELFLSVA